MPGFPKNESRAEPRSPASALACTVTLWITTAIHLDTLLMQDLTATPIAALGYQTWVTYLKKSVKLAM